MSESDAVLDALLDLARAGFPTAFTVDPKSDFRRLPWIPGPGTDLSEFPSHAAFEDALAHDEQLSAFAPPNEPFVQSTSGAGWLMETGVLASSLITTATASHLARGNATDDLDGFLSETRSALDTFRRLVAGELVSITVVVGFDGITLSANSRVQTCWGTIRPASELETMMRPFGSGPSAILTMETPTRFRIDGDQQTEFHADYYALQRAVDRSTLLLPLATLLGLERPDFVVPAVVWYTLILPGERGVGFYTPDVRRVRSRQATRFMDVPSIRMGGEPLTPEEEARLIDWCVLVEDSYDDVIAIAVRRTIRAILERGDAEDALIDAVMATENLFGHGAATEVTFRVTTALAHLLEPEPTKRIALRKELGNVYDVRSKVVHGAKITPNMRLAERKEEAIKTAVQALRILFKERPHLISDNERGMRLVLGAAGPEGHTPPAD